MINFEKDYKKFLFKLGRKIIRISKLPLNIKRWVSMVTYPAKERISFYYNGDLFYTLHLSTICECWSISIINEFNNSLKEKASQIDLKELK